MTQLKYLLLASVCLYLPAAFAAAAAESKPQSVQPVPVGKELLDGTRLILKQAGCSLELPGAGWRWMTIEKSEKIFLCVNAKFDMLVISTSAMKSEMTAHQPESLIKNVRLTTEARGGKISADKFELIELPGAKKAAHVSFQEELNGNKKYAYIYLAQTSDDTLLKLHITAADKTSEPDELKKMAQSIKLLAEKK